MKTNSFACLAFLSTWPASSIGQLRAIRGTSRKDLFPSPRTLQNSDTPFLPDSVHYATGVVGGSAFGSKTTGDGLYTYSSVNAKAEDDGVATNAPVSAASSKFPNNGIVNMDEVDGGSGFGSTTTGGGLYTYSTVNAVESPDFVPLGTSTDVISGGAAGVNPSVSSRIIPAPTLRPVRSSIPTRRPTQRPVLLPASTSRPTKKAALTKIPTRSPIPAPVNDNLAGLAASWVVAHNIRREYLHRAGSKSFVPLTWSNTLAVSAQAYAEELLSYSPQCAIVHGYNGNSFGGENVAANWGYGSYLYSRSRTPEEVLQAWFEDEMGRPYGANGHFTQVGWRATKYVGCGMASKTFGSGSTCNIQVCRYIKPGNCNVNSENWYSNMLADESWCDPQCPLGGCF